MPLPPIITSYASSRSDPKRTYRIDYITREAAGESGPRMVCDCPGFQFRGSCHHTERVNREMSTQTLERPAADGTAIAVRDPQADHAGALQIVRPTSILPSERDLTIIKGLANMAARAKGHLVPAHIDTAEKAAAVMLYGLELGLRPMTALQHVYLVKGRAALSGQAMMGIVLAKVPNARFVCHQTDEKVADWSLFLPGKPELRLSYTIEDATRSGQVANARGQQAKGTWDLYAPDMLRWNCIKRLCRLGAPHVINAVEGADLGGVVAMADMISEGEDYAEDERATGAPISEIPADAYNEGDTPRPELSPRAEFLEVARAAGYDVPTDSQADRLVRGKLELLAKQVLTDEDFRAATRMIEAEQSESLVDEFARE